MHSNHNPLVKTQVHFQNLVGAREKEIESEDHLLKIADREEGRLNQEISRIQKEMEELKEQKNIYEVRCDGQEYIFNHLMHQMLDCIQQLKLCLQLRQ